MTEDVIDEDVPENETWGQAPPFIPSLRNDESKSASQFRADLERLSLSDDPLLEKGTLGCYQLQRKIGRGGMGTVYAARDPVNHRSVAIKILHAALNQDEVLRRRFQREARMLAEIDSIHVTKLYEIAEADGCFFLVMELVEGQSLAERIKSSGRLSEREAIDIAVDVATALMQLHEHGIVHRDVKPENILLCPLDTNDVEARRVLAKLTDLGIARQEQAAESVALTSAQSMLGTPLYMSPEHFYGGAQVNNQSDLYSLGATLFHALTGQPPFQAGTALALADAHRHSPSPNPQSVNKLLSDGVCEVVIKSLQKRPDLRYRSAAEFLDDLLHLQRGEATSMKTHPLLPATDSGRMATFSFSWELSCSPEDLWPFVSNTERLNRAINLPSVEFSMRRTESGDRQRFAEFRFAGMRMQWREHMFEWIEAQRLSVLREYQRGPLRWLTSVVDLHRRADGGTTLTHSFKANCRHLPGLLFAKFQMQAVTRRALDRVYRRIDAVVGNQLQSDILVDAFEESRSLKRQSSVLLEQILGHLSLRQLNRTALLRVADYVRFAAAQDVSHIRPRALARKLNLPAESVVDVCLYGVHEGLFDLSWDVICPSCRIAAQSQDAIENIRKHARCEACDFDFEVDFATSVEMILRTSPRIRKLDTGQYCIGGPAHSPHVVAQARVAANETVNLGLELPEGRYVLRGPQLPFSIALIVANTVQQNRLFVDISLSAARQSPIELRTQRQLITVSNRGNSEILLRIERSAIPDDAITALQAAGMPFFRRSFPDHIPTAEQVAGTQHLTFVVVMTHKTERLAMRYGELDSCDLLKNHLGLLVDHASRFGGSFVRPFEEGGLLVFRNQDSAIQALKCLAETIPELDGVAAWQPVIAAHQGRVMVTTINGQLEYLGSALRVVQALTAAGMPGEITTTPELAARLESAEFQLVSSPHEHGNGSVESTDPVGTLSVVRFRQPSPWKRCQEPFIDSRA